MSGFVYVIRAGNAVKIGYSRRVDVRLTEIQALNHERCDLLATIPATHRVERMIHNLLKADRIRGEWFHYSPRVMEAVDQAARIVPDAEEEQGAKDQGRATALDAYLRENKITESAFARELGTSQSHVHRLRTGESWPSRDLAVRIRDATAGQVTADDFLPPTAS